MSFFKNLFGDRKATREAIRRYVDIEFRDADRDAEYSRLVKEAGL